MFKIINNLILFYCSSTFESFDYLKFEQKYRWTEFFPYILVKITMHKCILFSKTSKVSPRHIILIFICKYYILVVQIIFLNNMGSV